MYTVTSKLINARLAPNIEAIEISAYYSGGLRFVSRRRERVTASFCGFALSLKSNGRIVH